MALQVNKNIYICLKKHFICSKLTMTSHQIILICFLSVVGLIIVSAYMLKIVRNNKEKHRVPEPQVAKKINIELKEDIFELDKLSIILEDLVRYNIPVKTILDLNIIIEEVFIGIVNRLNIGRNDARVFITLVLEPGQISVSITDHNDEFNPTVTQKIDLNAPLEEISFHGLGFHLVRHLVDDISYQRLDGRNILSMKKNYTT